MDHIQSTGEEQIQLIEDIGREIRCQLISIIGTADQLADTGLNADQTKRTQKVKNAVDSLLTTVNNLLDFSALNRDKLELEAIDFNLKSALESANGLLQHIAQRHNCSYSLDIKAETPELLVGDPTHLRQAMVSLCRCCGSLAAPKSKIVLSIACDKVENNRARLVFTVDCLAAADRSIASYQQQEEALLALGETGLGLSVARRIAQQMGGEVGVKIGAQNRASFWFCAELSQQKQQVLEHQVVLKKSIEGQRVLVITDDANTERWLQILLRSWKCSGDTTTTSEFHLDLLHKAVADNNPYGFVILDIANTPTEPDICPGEEFGRQIQMDPTAQSTHLVLLTANGRRGDVKRLQRAGYAAYLTKPVDRSLLFDCLCTVLGNAQTPSPLPSIVTRHTIADLRQRQFRVLIAQPQSDKGNYEDFFQDLGCLPDTAYSGLATIGALQEKLYDLVLINCQMPDIDGYLLTQAIRSDDSEVHDHNVPVIAVTQGSTKEVSEKCRHAGVSDWLPAPVEWSALSHKVRHHLHLPKNAAGATQAEEPAPPGFDISTLAGRLMGDEELAKEIVLDFVKEAPTQLAGLEKALDAGDTKQVVHWAHTIKGAATNIGATAMGTTALELEKAGKASELKKLVHLMPELNRQFQHLQQAVSKLA